MKRLLMALIFAAGLGPLPAAAGDPEDVRAAFDRFVAAQNAHDAKSVSEMLKVGDEFLWITRGAAVWGHDTAMKRFESLYAGTWSLDPAMADFRVIPLGAGVAQIFVPVAFQIGAAGQPAQTVKFLMNQTLVKGASGWRIASILPIPLPP